MVIKEEKTWSPILDMDMVKHMVSSSLFGGSLSLSPSLPPSSSSWNSKKQFPLHLFVVLTKMNIDYTNTYTSLNIS